MAKMFYTLEETAQKLGVGEDKVKEMTAAGQLQQFRDRDKLMFKCEQVDALAGGKNDSSGPISLAGSGDSSLGGVLPLADSSDTDAINLSDTSKGGTAMGSSAAGSAAGGTAGPGASGTAAPGPGGKKKDPRERTGVSVFDAGEVEPVDPGAQTVVTNAVGGAEEELALESVGSGSGLLDLTRESDDTSLGAELLDEIYPGGSAPGATAADTKVETATGSSGVFDGATTMEPSASGLENLQQPTATTGGTFIEVPVESEVYDPAGSGLTVGAMVAASITLIIGLIIAISAVGGVQDQVTALLSASSNALWGYVGGLAVMSIVFILAGLFIGKSKTKGSRA